MCFETQKRKVKSTCFKNCLCFKTQKRKVKSMCFKNSDFNQNQNPRLKSIYFLHFKKCRNLSNSSLNVHFFFWNFMLLIERKSTKMANQVFNFCSIFTSCILWNAGTKNCIAQECRKQGWSGRSLFRLFSENVKFIISMETNSVLLVFTKMMP